MIVKLTRYSDNSPVYVRSEDISSIEHRGPYIEDEPGVKYYHPSVITLQNGKIHEVKESPDDLLCLMDNPLWYLLYRGSTGLDHLTSLYEEGHDFAYCKRKV